MVDSADTHMPYLHGIIDEDDSTILPPLPPAQVDAIPLYAATPTTPLTSTHTHTLYFNDKLTLTAQITHLNNSVYLYICAPHDNSGNHSMQPYNNLCIITRSPHDDTDTTTYHTSTIYSSPANTDAVEQQCVILGGKVMRQLNRADRCVDVMYVSYDGVADTADDSSGTNDMLTAWLVKQLSTKISQLYNTT